MGLINKQMAQPDPDEQAEDPKEEATESPAAEQAEDAQEPDAQEGGADEEQAESPGAEKAEGGGGLTITPQSVQEKLHLQPKQVPILQRVVVAGMKIMFDAKTHKLMLDTLQGQGDIATKLGQGITGLMGLLMKEAKGAIPGEMIIPAGIVLMAHAAEFVDKTGTPVTDEDFGNGVQVFVHTIMKVSGMDGDKAASLGEQATAGQGAPANQAGAGAPPADDESAEDPAEEATESPQAEQAEDAQEPDEQAGQPPLKGMIRRGMQ